MRITIVGTGYVGLTTGVCLARLGHEVSCVDAVPERVAAVSAGKVPFHEPSLDAMLAAALASGRFRCVSDLAPSVAAGEITFIAVGTPSSPQGIDLGHVVAAARQVGAALPRASGYHVVVVKSTVTPGSTDTVVRQALEEGSGLKAGDFGLCMNPEFLAEGTAVEDFMNPDRIVIGQWDARSGATLARVYESFHCPKVLTTLRNAEMSKYASNAFLATLISFSNELAALCEATPDTDVKVVLDTLRLDRRLCPLVEGRRISPGILSFLWAGCGFGGSCLPKDLNAFRAYARARDVVVHLLDAVATINRQRPAVLVKMAEDALGSLEHASVSVLGLAFKPATDDLRDSVALTVLRLLGEKGAVLRAYDPLVTALPGDLSSLVTIGKTPAEALFGVDAAIITTACPEFAAWDWPGLCSTMRRPLVIDGRNAFHSLPWPAWVRYLPIGRLHQTSRAETVSHSGRAG